MTLLVSSWEAGLFCHVLWRNVTGNVMAWLHPGMFLTLCWPYSYRSPSFGFLLPSWVRSPVPPSYAFSFFVRASCPLGCHRML